MVPLPSSLAGVAETGQWAKGEHCLWSVPRTLSMVVQPVVTAVVISPMALGEGQCCLVSGAKTSLSVGGRCSDGVGDACCPAVIRLPTMVGLSDGFSPPIISAFLLMVGAGSQTPGGATSIAGVGPNLGWVPTGICNPVGRLC